MLEWQRESRTVIKGKTCMNRLKSLDRLQFQLLTPTCMKRQPKRKQLRPSMTIKPVSLSIYDYQASEFIYLWLSSQWVYLSMTIKPVSLSIYDYQASELIYLWLSSQLVDLSMTIKPVSLSIYDYQASELIYLWLSSQWIDLSMTIKPVSWSIYDYQASELIYLICYCNHTN